MLISKVAVNLKVFADALDHLEAYVVQRGPARDEAGVRGTATIGVCQRS